MGLGGSKEVSLYLNVLLTSMPDRSLT